FPYTTLFRSQLGVPARRLVVQRVVEQELLGGVHVLGVVGDDPVVHDMGGDHPVGGPFQGGAEERVGGDFGVCLLGGAVCRDRVEDVGQLTGDQALVVGGRLPGEHLVGHRPFEEVPHVLD